jgi:hypothetical protein
MEVLQGNLLKQLLGWSKSLTSNLLMALGVPKIRGVILEKQCKLVQRLMYWESPCCSRLYQILLAKYIRTGTYCKATLMGRIIASGLSPLTVMMNGARVRMEPTAPNGVVDTIHPLLHHPQYNRRQSRGAPDAADTDQMYFLNLIFHLYVILCVYVNVDILFPQIGG